MGMFGGAKKKKVPNSRKKKGAVAAKEQTKTIEIETPVIVEKAPEPEQPVVEKPTVTPSAKPVLSVAERAKAINGGGLKPIEPAVATAPVTPVFSPSSTKEVNSSDDKPTEEPPAKELKKSGSKFSLFGKGKKKKAEAKTDDAPDSEQAGDESESAEEGASKRKEMKKSGSKFSLFGKGRRTRKSETEATNTPAKGEPEEPAAEESSAAENEPEKRKSFGLFSKKKKEEEAEPTTEEPATEEPETKKSGLAGLFGKKKADGENEGNKSPAPAVPGKPGKLSMNKLALNIPGLGGPRGTNLQEKSAPGKPPPKIDIYAESEQNPDDQGHTEMSEKARQTLMAPKENNGKEDWKFMYELAKQYDNYKAQEAEATKKNSGKALANKSKTSAAAPEPAPGDTKAIKSNLNNLFGGGRPGGGVNMAANGSFLNNKYFDGFLVERSSGVAFEFSNETGLFRRFTQKGEQRSISQQFAAALLKHPKAKKITQLNMNGALLPDAFLVGLCEACAKSDGLPLLQVMNLESNDLGREAFEALAAIIANPKAWRRLQILKLENQKKEISVGAEEVLGEAIVKSSSIVQVGIQMKGGIPKQQIANTIQSNMDKLRVARREHAAKKGTLKARKRNEMETLFDTIAANKDKKLTEVDLTENLRFLGLDATERTKTGAAFVTNKYVSKVTMTKLKLDDDFAEAFGKALAKNNTLETVVLDSNSFSAKGVIALLTGLGQNKSVASFQVRHQSKTMASADEEALPDLLKDNTTLVKLGTDVRNPLIKSKLDRKMKDNGEIQRKLRVAQKKK